MNHNIQQIRHDLVEQGWEYTPAEIKKALDILDRAIEEMTFDDYLYYKNIDDEEINDWASRYNKPKEDMAVRFGILVRLGQAKFG